MRRGVADDVTLAQIGPVLLEVRCDVGDNHVLANLMISPEVTQINQLRDGFIW